MNVIVVIKIVLSFKFVFGIIMLSRILRMIINVRVMYVRFIIFFLIVLFCLFFGGINFIFFI